MGRVTLALVLVLASNRAAHADWFVTPYLGLKFAGATNFVDLEFGASNTKATLGVTAGVLSDGLFGVEADVGYTPRFFERSSGSLVASSQVFTVMGNLIVTVPRSLTGYSLRPFVSGGAGLMHVSIDDVAGVIPINSNLFGVNVGGGAVGGLTYRASIRFDLRYFKGVTTTEEEAVGLGRTTLSFWRAAVGLTIR
jgi:Outer membrane protein beta-barrel domain